MKRFFDSSVLVPVFYADHPQHASCTKVFLEAGKADFCALRTLGEVYATLTGPPLRPRITGPEGMSIVRQIRERLTLITLSEQEYVSAFERASSGAIVGAAAYDALIAHCESGSRCLAELECPRFYKARIGCRTTRQDSAGTAAAAFRMAHPPPNTRGRQPVTRLAPSFGLFGSCAHSFTDVNQVGWPLATLSAKLHDDKSLGCDNDSPKSISSTGVFQLHILSSPHLSPLFLSERNCANLLN